MLKKFYVGAKHIGAAIANGGNASCQRASFDEAVAEAKNVIRDYDLECVVIVEIVAIVRKEFPPIVVEKV